MLTVQTILFERAEREVLSLARLSAPILLESTRAADALDGTDPAEALRLLSGIAQRGDQLTWARIERARRVYTALLEVLREESDPRHWELALGPEPVVGAPSAVSPIDVLVEARTRQHREVEAARELLLLALESIPPDSRSPYVE